MSHLNTSPTTTVKCLQGVFFLREILSKSHLVVNGSGLFPETILLSLLSHLNNNITKVIVVTPSPNHEVINRINRHFRSNGLGLIDHYGDLNKDKNNNTITNRTSSTSIPSMGIFNSLHNTNTNTNPLTSPNSNNTNQPTNPSQLPPLPNTSTILTRGGGGVNSIIAITPAQLISVLYQKKLNTSHFQHLIILDGILRESSVLRNQTELLMLLLRRYKYGGIITAFLSFSSHFSKIFENLDLASAVRTFHIPASNIILLPHHMTNASISQHVLNLGIFDRGGKDCVGHNDGDNNTTNTNNSSNNSQSLSLHQTHLIDDYNTVLRNNDLINESNLQKTIKFNHYYLSDLRFSTAQSIIRYHTMVLPIDPIASILSTYISERYRKFNEVNIIKNRNFFGLERIDNNFSHSSSTIYQPFLNKSQGGMNTLMTKQSNNNNGLLTNHYINSNRVDTNQQKNENRQQNQQIEQNQQNQQNQQNHQTPSKNPHLSQFLFEKPIPHYLYNLNDYNQTLLPSSIHSANTQRSSVVGVYPEGLPALLSYPSFVPLCCHKMFCHLISLFNDKSTEHVVSYNDKAAIEAFIKLFRFYLLSFDRSTHELYKKIDQIKNQYLDQNSDLAGLMLNILNNIEQFIVAAMYQLQEDRNTELFQVDSFVQDLYTGQNDINFTQVSSTNHIPSQYDEGNNGGMGKYQELDDNNIFGPLNKNPTSQYNCNNTSFSTPHPITYSIIHRIDQYGLGMSSNRSLFESTDEKFKKIFPSPRTFSNHHQNDQNYQNDQNHPNPSPNQQNHPIYPPPKPTPIHSAPFNTVFRRLPFITVNQRAPMRLVGSLGLFNSMLDRKTTLSTNDEKNLITGSSLETPRKRPRMKGNEGSMTTTTKLSTPSTTSTTTTVSQDNTVEDSNIQPRDNELKITPTTTLPQTLDPNEKAAQNGNSYEKTAQNNNPPLHLPPHPQHLINFPFKMPFMHPFESYQHSYTLFTVDSVESLELLNDLFTTPSTISLSTRPIVSLSLTQNTCSDHNSPLPHCDGDTNYIGHDNDESICNTNHISINQNTNNNNNNNPTPPNNNIIFNVLVTPRFKINPPTDFNRYHYPHYSRRKQALIPSHLSPNPYINLFIPLPKLFRQWFSYIRQLSQGYNDAIEVAIRAETRVYRAFVEFISSPELPEVLNIMNDGFGVAELNSNQGKSRDGIKRSEEKGEEKSGNKKDGNNGTKEHNPMNKSYSQMTLQGGGGEFTPFITGSYDLVSSTGLDLLLFIQQFQPNIDLAAVWARDDKMPQKEQIWSKKDQNSQIIMVEQDFNDKMSDDTNNGTNNNTNKLLYSRNNNNNSTTTTTTTAPRQSLYAPRTTSTQQQSSSTQLPNSSKQQLSKYNRYIEFINSISALSELDYTKSRSHGGFNNNNIMSNNSNNINNLSNNNNNSPNTANNNYFSQNKDPYRNLSIYTQYEAFRIHSGHHIKAQTQQAAQQKLLLRQQQQQQLLSQQQQLQQQSDQTQAPKKPSLYTRNKPLVGSTVANSVQQQGPLNKVRDGGVQNVQHDKDLIIPTTINALSSLNLIKLFQIRTDIADIINRHGLRDNSTRFMYISPYAKHLLAKKHNIIDVKNQLNVEPNISFGHFRAGMRDEDIKYYKNIKRVALFELAQYYASLVHEIPYHECGQEMTIIEKESTKNDVFSTFSTNSISRTTIRDMTQLIKTTINPAKRSYVDQLPKLLSTMELVKSDKGDEQSGNKNDKKGVKGDKNGERVPKMPEKVEKVDKSVRNQKNEPKEPLTEVVSIPIISHEIVHLLQLYLYQQKCNVTVNKNTSSSSSAHINTISTQSNHYSSEQNHNSFSFSQIDHQNINLQPDPKPLINHYIIPTPSSFHNTITSIIDPQSAINGNNNTSFIPFNNGKDCNNTFIHSNNDNNNNNNNNNNPIPDHLTPSLYSTLHKQHHHNTTTTNCYTDLIFSSPHFYFADNYVNNNDIVTRWISDYRRHYEDQKIQALGRINGTIKRAGVNKALVGKNTKNGNNNGNNNGIVMKNTQNNHQNNKSNKSSLPSSQFSSKATQRCTGSLMSNGRLSSNNVKSAKNGKNGPLDSTKDDDDNHDIFIDGFQSLSQISSLHSQLSQNPAQVQFSQGNNNNNNGAMDISNSSSSQVGQINTQSHRNEIDLIGDSDQDVDNCFLSSSLSSLSQRKPSRSSSSLKPSLSLSSPLSPSPPSPIDSIPEPLSISHAAQVHTLNSMYWTDYYTSSLDQVRAREDETDSIFASLLNPLIEIASDNNDGADASGGEVNDDDQFDYSNNAPSSLNHSTKQSSSKQTKRHNIIDQQMYSVKNHNTMAIGSFSTQSICISNPFTAPSLCYPSMTRPFADIHRDDDRDNVNVNTTSTFHANNIMNDNSTDSDSDLFDSPVSSRQDRISSSLDHLEAGKQDKIIKVNPTRPLSQCISQVNCETRVCLEQTGIKKYFNKGVGVVGPGTGMKMAPKKSNSTKNDEKIAILSSFGEKMKDSSRTMTSISSSNHHSNPTLHSLLDGHDTLFYGTTNVRAVNQDGSDNSDREMENQEQNQPTHQNQTEPSQKQWFSLFTEAEMALLISFLSLLIETLSRNPPKVPHPSPNSTLLDNSINLKYTIKSGAIIHPLEWITWFKQPYILTDLSSHFFHNLNFRSSIQTPIDTPFSRTYLYEQSSRFPLGRRCKHPSYSYLMGVFNRNMLFSPFSHLNPPITPSNTMNGALYNITPKVLDPNAAKNTAVRDRKKGVVSGGTNITVIVKNTTDSKVSKTTTTTTTTTPKTPTTTTISPKSTTPNTSSYPNNHNKASNNGVLKRFVPVLGHEQLVIESVDYKQLLSHFSLPHHPSQYISSIHSLPYRFVDNLSNSLSYSPPILKNSSSQLQLSVSTGDGKTSSLFDDLQQEEIEKQRIYEKRKLLGPFGRSSHIFKTELDGDMNGNESLIGGIARDGNNNNGTNHQKLSQTLKASKQRQNDIDLTNTSMTIDDDDDANTKILGVVSQPRSLWLSNDQRLMLLYQQQSAFTKSPLGLSMTSPVCNQRYSHQQPYNWAENESFHNGQQGQTLQNNHQVRDDQTDLNLPNVVLSTSIQQQPNLSFFYSEGYTSRMKVLISLYTKLWIVFGEELKKMGDVKKNNCRLEKISHNDDENVKNEQNNNTNDAFFYKKINTSSSSPHTPFSTTHLNFILIILFTLSQPFSTFPLPLYPNKEHLFNILASSHSLFTPSIISLNNPCTVIENSLGNTPTAINAISHLYHNGQNKGIINENVILTTNQQNRNNHLHNPLQRINHQTTTISPSTSTTTTSIIGINQQNIIQNHNPPTNNLKNSPPLILSNAHINPVSLQFTFVNIESRTFKNRGSRISTPNHFRYYILNSSRHFLYHLNHQLWAMIADNINSTLFQRICERNVLLLGGEVGLNGRYMFDFDRIVPHFVTEPPSASTLSGTTEPPSTSSFSPHDPIKMSDKQFNSLARNRLFNNNTTTTSQTIPSQLIKQSEVYAELTKKIHKLLDNKIIDQMGLFYPTVDRNTTFSISEQRESEVFHQLESSIQSGLLMNVETVDDVLMEYQRKEDEMVKQWQNMIIFYQEQGLSPQDIEHEYTKYKLSHSHQVHANQELIDSAKDDGEGLWYRNSDDNGINPYIKLKKYLEGVTKDLPPHLATVQVDSRELRGALILYLEKQRFDITIATFTTGDYILLHGLIGIERKAPKDLIQSLEKGRLMEQLGRMQTVFPRPILLVEYIADPLRLQPPFSTLKAFSKFNLERSRLPRNAPRVLREANYLILQIVATFLTFPAVAWLWSDSAMTTCGIFSLLQRKFQSEFVNPNALVSITQEDADVDIDDVDYDDGDDDEKKGKRGKKDKNENDSAKAVKSRTTLGQIAWSEGGLIDTEADNRRQGSVHGIDTDSDEGDNDNDDDDGLRSQNDGDNNTQNDTNNDENDDNDDNDDQKDNIIDNEMNDDNLDDIDINSQDNPFTQYNNDGYHDDHNNLSMFHDLNEHDENDDDNNDNKNKNAKNDNNDDSDDDIDAFLDSDDGNIDDDDDDDYIASFQKSPQRIKNQQKIKKQQDKMIEKKKMEQFKKEQDEEQRKGNNNYNFLAINLDQDEDFHDPFADDDDDTTTGSYSVTNDNEQNDNDNKMSKNVYNKDELVLLSLDTDPKDVKDDKTTIISLEDSTPPPSSSSDLFSYTKRKSIDQQHPQGGIELDNNTTTTTTTTTTVKKTRTSLSSSSTTKSNNPQSTSLSNSNTNNTEKILLYDQVYRILLQFPGITRGNVRDILTSFKSIQDLCKASLDDIIKCIGKNNGTQLYLFLQRSVV